MLDPLTSWTGDLDLASMGSLKPAKRRHYVAEFIVTWRPTSHKNILFVNVHLLEENVSD